MSDARDDAGVGSLGEEAVKLFGALSGWAMDHGGQGNEKVATGSAECAVCPICRVVHAVRQFSPEVMGHLAAAADSLAQAAAALTAPPKSSDHVYSPGVGHIEPND